MKIPPFPFLSLPTSGAVLAALATVTFSTPSPVHGANGSWLGTNGSDWSDSGNWHPAVPGATVGAVSTDVATFFGSPANRAIVVDPGRNVRMIEFASSAADFVIGSAGGNALTLTAGGGITYRSNAASNLVQAVNAPLSLAGSATFLNENTLESGNVLSLGGSITSLGNFTKSGAGEVKFSGASLSASRLIVNAGVMTLGGGNVALSAPSNSYALVSSGALLRIESGTMTFGSTAGNAFGGDGSVLQTGGQVIIGDGATFSSATWGAVVANYTISGGAFVIEAANGMRGMRNFTAEGNAVVNIDATTARISEGAVAGTLTIKDNASVVFAVAPILTQNLGSTATINLDGGTLTIPNLSTGGNAGGASTLSLNGGVLKFSSAATINADSQVKTVKVGNGGAIIDTNGFNVNFSRALTADGTGGLTKMGSGTLTLGAANTYTGTTLVLGGELRAGVATSAFGNQSALVTANTAGAVLNLANLNQTIGSLAGGGASGGNVLLGTGTLTVGGNNTSTVYAGVISGAGALVKEGSGSLTLSGDQSYTGRTVVSLGTLVVNGELASSEITVEGGTLGGNITAGAVVIGEGGTLAVGNSAGVGNFSSLDLSAGTSLTEMEFEAGATGAGAGLTFDTINVSSGIIYGGELRLVFNGAVGADTFDLFNFGVLVPSGDFASISLYANDSLIGVLSEDAGVWSGTYDLGFGSGSQTFEFTSATGDLVIAVPEPGAAVLAGLGIGVILLRRRRAIR
jgi:autotransporter-associated beta strand protein